MDMSITRAGRVVRYPHSDGKPMAEMPQRLEAMIYLITARPTAGEDMDRKYRLDQLEPVTLYRLIGRKYQQAPNERRGDREWRATSELLG